MNWDDHASTWDTDPVTRAYAQAAFQTLLGLEERHGLRLQGARVLDFGCGTGLLTELIAPSAEQIVAIDSSSAMIEILMAKLKDSSIGNVTALATTLETGLHEKTPVFADPFDVVVCSSVCAFLDDYLATVEALIGLLGPGGAFVQFDWERNEADEEPFGFTVDEIQDTLQRAGLTQVVAKTAFEVPIEGMVMAPLLGVGWKRGP